MNLGRQRPQRNSKADRVGKLGTAGVAEDIAGSGLPLARSTDYFVAQSADTALHHRKGRSRGHTPVRVRRVLRRANPEV